MWHTNLQPSPLVATKLRTPAAPRALSQANRQLALIRGMSADIDAGKASSPQIARMPNSTTRSRTFRQRQDWRPSIDCGATAGWSVSYGRENCSVVIERTPVWRQEKPSLELGVVGIAEGDRCSGASQRG